VGTRFWQLLQEGASFAEAQQALLEEYNVEEETLTPDLDALLGELKKQPLTEDVPGAANYPEAGRSGG